MKITETVTIDGMKFHSTQLPATRAYLLLGRMGSIIAPAVATIAAAEDFDTAAGPAMLTLTTKLSQDELAFLQKELLEGVQLHSETSIAPLLPQVNTALQGRVSTMLKLMAFCLRHNFSDFLEEGGVLNTILNAAKQKFETSITSAFRGQSGVAA